VNRANDRARLVADVGRVATVEDRTIDDQQQLATASSAGGYQRRCDRRIGQSFQLLVFLEPLTLVLGQQEPVKSPVFERNVIQTFTELLVRPRGAWNMVFDFVQFSEDGALTRIIILECLACA
jgi:hypothetical protein